ncbi:MAG: hypothetical protein LCH39_14720, partial [Proteobacteria bacterium]|nr:hypothetical protein [Pseudomonadota bacterium]
RGISGGEGVCGMSLSGGTAGQGGAGQRKALSSQNAPQCPKTCLITAHIQALDALHDTAGIGRRVALLNMLDGASC